MNTSEEQHAILGKIIISARLLFVSGGDGNGKTYSVTLCVKFKKVTKDLFL